MFHLKPQASHSASALQRILAPVISRAKASQPLSCKILAAAQLKYDLKFLFISK
jgi:hypothetical protein